MSKIQVRPLDIEKWHGKKGAESFTGTFTVTPLVSGTTGSYKTGLTEEEVVEYGKILNQNLSARYDRNKPHEFWDSESAAVKLENKTNFIDKKEALGYIHYKILLNSKFVANSMKEYEEGLWPEAIFVIVDEETDSDIKASKLSVIKQVILEGHKLSKDKKADIVLILSGKLIRGKSDNFVEVAFDEEVQKNPADVLRVMKMDKKQMATHALVLEALQKYILTKAGHRFMYHDSIIGEDIYSTVDYLEKPENQELKLRITEAVNN